MTPICFGSLFAGGFGNVTRHLRLANQGQHSCQLKSAFSLFFSRASAQSSGWWEKSRTHAACTPKKSQTFKNASHTDTHPFLFFPFTPHPPPPLLTFLQSPLLSPFSFLLSPPSPPLTFSPSLSLYILLYLFPFSVSVYLGLSCSHLHRQG